MNVLPSFVRGLINKGVDRIWERRLSRGYDPRRTIVVSGTPRGGTTWVAETLSNSLGYLYLHEPDFPHLVAETLAKVHPITHLWEPLNPLDPDAFGATGMNSELYIASNNVLHEHIKRTVSGNVRLSSYYRIKDSLRKMWSFQRLVVKFVRANLLLYWILKEFELKGVLIIRHPCAVVASQIHHKGGGICCGDPDSLDLIRKRFHIYERFEPSFANVIRSITTTEELLAFEWCIRTVVPLRQPKPHPWFLADYEGLIEDTLNWEKMCDYLDCPTPPKEAISRLSSMSHARFDESSPSAAIDKWRRYLTDNQIDNVLRVCSDMGVDFYDKSLYPRNLDNYR